jgi:Cellulase (glycosyl hydrolase family 5)/Ca-dependent carbohydrate-binding module xylan-binding
MSVTSSSSFHVSNGQIIGPNGQPFKAQGIDILESTLGSVVGDASGGALLKSFPATNMVRIAMESGYSSYNDPAFVNAVNWLTAKGIVVEIGNYNTTGGVATGQGLTDEVNWFAALASKYQNNPYVWFSTDNEPTDGNTFNGATTAEQLAAYNAIRGTGNTSMIGIEDTFATLNPANYAGMTNVHWDSHYYNWTAGYSADLATNEAAVNSRDALLNSLFKSADGTIPIITGEFGDSTDGQYIDAGGSAAAQAVVDVGPSHSGWTSWLYYWPGSYAQGMTGDELTDENTGQLTPYGQQIAGAMTAANAPSGGGGTVQPPANPLPAAAPVSTDSGARPPSLLPSRLQSLHLSHRPLIPPIAPPASALPVTTTGRGSDRLVLGMSEDAYKGDAKFTVSIDGKRLGGTFTTAALHGSGASQSFTFKGNIGSGQHAVAVSFLNDA